MDSPQSVTLTRDVEAAVVPLGTRVTLKQGEAAYIIQFLGGSYTVVVNGNMFRIDGRNADALGFSHASAPPESKPNGAPVSASDLEKQVWSALRTCYDPEIPVNIVDLGLVYDCQVVPEPMGTGQRVDVKMTLTAPGCGMGPVLQQDVQTKILSLEGVDEVNVELVWDPQWNQGMMSEAAKLQLGLL